MVHEWYNNRIGKELNQNYPKDFSLCDVDGIVRCHYSINEDLFTRLIIYESKNNQEKKMGKSQLMSLRKLQEAINWSMFDSMSGVYVLQIIDIDENIRWYSLDGVLIRKTTMSELYKIFSCK